MLVEVVALVVKGAIEGETVGPTELLSMLSELTGVHPDITSEAMMASPKTSVLTCTPAMLTDRLGQAVFAHIAPNFSGES